MDPFCFVMKSECLSYLEFLDEVKKRIIFFKLTTNMY